MHTNRYALRRHSHGSRTVSEPLSALEARQRSTDGRFKHKPKLRLVLAVPPPAQELIPLRRIPRDSWRDDELPTHVRIADNDQPSRLRSEAIWDVICDVVKDMPKSTPAIDNFSRVAHVYCGMVLNHQGRHAIQRYLHMHVVRWLSRLWRERSRTSEQHLFHVTKGLLQQIEKRVLKLFAAGVDLDDERPKGRRIRKVRLQEGSRHIGYITYEPNGSEASDEDALILTLQDQPRYSQTARKSRLHPRQHVRRPNDRGRGLTRCG